MSFEAASNPTIPCFLSLGSPPLATPVPSRQDVFFQAHTPLEQHFPAFAPGSQSQETTGISWQLQGERLLLPQWHQHSTQLLQVGRKHNQTEAGRNSRAPKSRSSPALLPGKATDPSRSSHPSSTVSTPGFFPGRKGRAPMALPGRRVAGGCEEEVGSR